MSKILTETSVHSASVVVPVAGEDVTAASVEVPLQSLTNRTRYAYDLARAMPLQNWQQCPATYAALVDYPRIGWVPSAADEAPGWWVIVCATAAAVVVLLTEDECGAQSVGAGVPVGVTDVTWIAVSPWDAALGCSPFIMGGAHQHVTVQRGALPGAPSWIDGALADGAVLHTETVGAVWSTAIGAFVVAGANDDTEPAIHLCSTGDPIVQTPVVITIDQSDACVGVAIDDDNDTILVVGNSTGGGSDTWILTDAGATVTLNTTAIENPVAVGFSAESGGVWMIIDDDGNVHTSSDALTWTKVASQVTDLGGFMTLAVVDGMWLVGSQSGYVVFSIDDGATWHRATVNGAASAAAPFVATRLGVGYSVGRRRFASVHVDGAQDLQLNRSLSIGVFVEHV